MVRTSRFVATFAVAAAALATAGTARATAPPTTQPAAGDSTPADSAPADSAMDGSQPVAGEPDLLAFSRCMRDNGIANFPDPNPNGINIDGLGIDPDSPQFKAAEEACKYLMPQPDAAAPSGSMSAGESEWEKVVPGGDCECADGSEFAFWVREGDPNKVVLYLDGGGSCFDETSCDYA